MLQGAVLCTSSEHIARARHLQLMQGGGDTEAKRGGPAPAPLAGLSAQFRYKGNQGEPGSKPTNRYHRSFSQPMVSVCPRRIGQ